MPRRRCPLLAAFLLLGLLATLATGRARAAPDDGSPSEAEWELAQAVVAELRAGDAVALAERVDWPARREERVARGLETRAWSLLDDVQRVALRRRTSTDWVTDDAAFLHAAVLHGLVRLPDPDAGRGPVPERHVLQAVLRSVQSNAYRDLLLVTGPDLALLDLELGPTYAQGADPAGPAGLQPRPWPLAEAGGVRWPDDLDDLDRAEARELVDLLLGPDGDDPRQRALTVESLHRVPRAAVAALVERLLALEQRAPSSAAREPHATPQDAPAQARLAAALETLTGRPAGVTAAPTGDQAVADWLAANHQAVLGWKGWHDRNGASFTPTPIVDPLDPTFSERTGGWPSIHLPRWERALAEKQAQAGRSTEDGTGPTVPAGESTVPLPGKAPAGHGAGPPAGTPADHAGPPSDQASPPVAAGDNDAPQAVAELAAPAGDLTLFAGPAEIVRAATVSATLTPAVRDALELWAPIVTRFELGVALADGDGPLLLGRGPVDALRELADLASRAADLLAPCLPPPGDRPDRAVVIVLLDPTLTAQGTWGAFLDDLVGQRLLPPLEAERLHAVPGPLVLPRVPLVVQPVDADQAAGSVSGAVVDRATTCLLAGRCGPLPPGLLTALGQLAEQRLLGRVTLFPRRGFVPGDADTGWPAAALALLERARRDPPVDLAAVVIGADTADADLDDQRLAWAAAEGLMTQHPRELGALLADLSELQRRVDPHGLRDGWEVDEARTAQALRPRLDRVDLDALAEQLRSPP